MGYAGRPGNAEAFAVGKVLKVEADVDRETPPIGPTEIGTRGNRAEAESVVRSEHRALIFGICGPEISVRARRCDRFHHDPRLNQLQNEKPEKSK
jgi:hypothetical protein